MAKTAAKKKSNSLRVKHKGNWVYGAVATNILKKRAERAKARNGKAAKKPNARPAAKKNATKKKANLDHRDAAHPIEVSHYWQGRKGYETQWQRAHKAGQGQLFSMNPKVDPYSKAGKQLFKRLFDIGINRGRNPGGAASAADDFLEFQGRESSETLSLVTPDGTPKHTSVCGPIPRIELMNGTKLNFNESEGARPILLRRGNKLYIASEGFRWSAPGEIGLVKRIHYITAKDHINDGELIQYHHRFGEEGGHPPMLIADQDCMFKLEGGSYEITGDGIRD